MHQTSPEMVRVCVCVCVCVLQAACFFHLCLPFRTRSHDSQNRVVITKNNILKLAFGFYTIHFKSVFMSLTRTLQYMLQTPTTIFPPPNTFPALLAPASTSTRPTSPGELHTTSPPPPTAKPQNSSMIPNLPLPSRDAAARTSIAALGKPSPTVAVSDMTHLQSTTKWCPCTTAPARRMSRMTLPMGGWA